MNKFHFTFSREVNGRCACGGETVLCCANEEWAIDYESEHYADHHVIGMPEVTAHVCIKCGALCSLSVNANEALKPEASQ